MSDASDNLKLKAERAELLDLLKQLYDHGDYCGWGDSWERQVVVEPGGLVDRVRALLLREGLL